MAAVIFVVLVGAVVGAWARSAGSVGLAPTAVLKVDLHHPGHEFAAGAVGLSMEARELSSGYISAEHARLVRLMRLLGPSVLRIGGNSVDSSWWTADGELPPSWATSIVTPTDFYALRALTLATGWKVLLGLDLGHFEPTRAADEASSAQKILGSHLLGLEIGNEPDDFGHGRVGLRSPTYGVNEYLGEAEVYRQALAVTTPQLTVYGPAFSGTEWLTQMGTTASIFSEITQHYYPTKVCPDVSSGTVVQQPTAAELLSPAVRQHENETLNTLTWVRSVTGRQTRISETGSGVCDGNSTASPEFASALWLLDWILRAGSSGVTSLNFHSHLGVCGDYTQSPVCAVDLAAARAGYVAAQPGYYGMLAASRLEGGRFVPTSLRAADQTSNITTWATLAPNGTITIAIDNLDTSGLAQPVSIQTTAHSATVESLQAQSVEARRGVVLGGVEVVGDGQWRPRPTKFKRVAGSIRVIVRPASAIIVTLRRAGPRHRG